MNFSYSLKSILIRLVIYIALAGVVVGITAGVSFLFAEANIADSVVVEPLGAAALAEGISSQEIQLSTFETTEIRIPEESEVINLEAMGNFVAIDTNKLIISPDKYDLGQFKFTIRPESTLYSANRQIYSVSIQITDFDEANLEKQLRSFLGNRIDNYGIYVYDLQREQDFRLNADEIFPPASLSKIPGAILTLRDIDSGKLSFDDTYPLQQQYKHGSIDELAKQPNGTEITVKEYLERLILRSNNTAQYHLRGLLGGSYEALNPRTIDELGVNPFFENPHIATAKDVGKVLIDVYNRETLSNDSAEFLLNLMKNAVPDLKMGIPAGVPDNVEVANKVGFLFGGREGSTYADAGIIYGTKTDYVLVVLNDKAPPYPKGAPIIADISKIVYEQLQ